MSWHFAANACRLRGVCRIVAQQVAVSLHRGAATRGVDDDGVGVGAFERVDQFSRRRHGIFFFAGVFGERSAARLRLRHDDFAAFRGEHARRRLVDVSEEHTLDASEQQRDAPALLLPAPECARADRRWPKVIAGSRRSIACRRFGSSVRSPDECARR